MSIAIDFIIIVITMLATVYTAGALAKYRRFDFLKDRKGRHETLDGLRGYLALAVLIHHFIITWYWKDTGRWADPPEAYFLNLGRVGVSIFFIITGFLFTEKLLKPNRSVDWLKLYESRVFRLFPIYLFSLLLISVIIFVTQGFKLNVSILELAKQYGGWLVFHGSNINEFPSTGRLNAYVAWTLKYELFFYLSLPVIFFLMFKTKKVGVPIVLALCVIGFLVPTKLYSISSEHLVFFGVGGTVAYALPKMFKLQSVIRTWQMSLLSSLLFLSALIYPSALDVIHVLLISAFFSLIVVGNDMFGLLRLKSSIFLGEISYGIYLMHGIVLYVFFTFSINDITSLVEFTGYRLFMPIVAALTVIISTFTYLLIEKPALTLGRKYLLTGALRKLSK